MQNLLVFLATAEPSPGEDLREGLDPEMVTPGTLGFLATLFVVIATVFLIRDMAKRVRRVRYREQVQADLEETAADDGTAAGATDTGATATDSPATDARGRGKSGDTDRHTEADAGKDTDRHTGTDAGNDTDRHTQDSNGAGPDRKG